MADELFDVTVYDHGREHRRVALSAVKREAAEAFQLRVDLGKVEGVKDALITPAGAKARKRRQRVPSETEDRVIIRASL